MILNREKAFMTFLYCMCYFKSKYFVKEFFSIGLLAPIQSVYVNTQKHHSTLLNKVIEAQYLIFL